MSLESESIVVAEKRTWVVYHAACTLAVCHPTSTPPPQPQHISFAVKSLSSNAPQSEGLSTYHGEQTSDHESVASPSESSQ